MRNIIFACGCAAAGVLAVKTDSIQKVKTLKDVGPNVDLTAPREEWKFDMPSPMKKAVESIMIEPEQDMALMLALYNIICMTSVTLPMVWIASLFYADDLSSYQLHAIGLVHFFGGLFSNMERFFLALHYCMHRPIFKKDLLIGQFLNGLPMYGMSMMFGMPPGVYRFHHCYMHHIENNSGDDISATEQYQRDSFTEFLRYYVRFSVHSHYEYFQCIWRNINWVGSTQKFVALAVIYYAYFGAMIFGMFLFPFPTFYTILAPWLLAFFAMAFGNWGQHIFVDPDAHADNYRLTYNIASSDMNRNTFNDGYHVIHHYNSRLHWSKLAEEFMKPEVIKKHYEKGAITFWGDVRPWDVATMTLSGQLRKLVEAHYVHIGPEDETPTVDEIVKELKRRCQKFDTFVPEHYGGPAKVVATDKKDM